MKTVIEMAREAGIDDWWDSGSDWRENFNEYLQAFAELVRADEREACAEIADSMDSLQDGAIGRAIRARGQA